MADTISFTGSVPINYDTVMGPVMFEPYAVETAKRVPASRDLLEIGAGTGRVTAHLAENIPAGGRLLATDLNDEMLAIAREKVKNPGVGFAVADANELPYDAEEFDTVVAQYVAMFFKDKVHAFRQIRRVLKQGGSLYMTVWGSTEQNPWMAVQQDAANHFLPEDQKVSVLDVPFGYCDEAVIEKDLKDAGFTDVKFEWVEKEFRAPSARTYAAGIFNGSPLTAPLLERGVTDMAPMIDLAAQNLAAKFGDPAVSPMWTLYVTAS